MQVAGRRVHERVADVLAICAFAGLGSLPRPGVGMALLVAAVGVAVGMGRNAVRRGVAALLLVVLVATTQEALDPALWYQVSGGLPSALLRTSVPWLVALALTSVVQNRRHAEERLAAQQHRRRMMAQREHDAERLALAELLHDDLGHSLSLVALTLATIEVDPAVSPGVLGAVSAARGDLSRAVERLGDSVSSLRTGSVLHTPRQESIAVMAARARTAGVSLTVRGVPTAERLSRFDQEAVERVVREAITNASKHSPGEHLLVDIVDEGDALRVLATNTVRPDSPPCGGSGTGLVVLRDHVCALGGELRTSSDDGRFILDARLPVDQRSAAVETRTGLAEQEIDVALAASRTRRHSSVVLGAAAAAVVLAVCVVEASAITHKRRALVSGETFAQIEVGGPREAATDLLPGQELPRASSSTAGPDCHDYAVTAYSVGDSAGDVFRVCFEGDVVASAERLAQGAR